jgi:acetylornithine aminotransferase
VQRKQFDFDFGRVQSGYGRSGKFFAHQEFDIKPDLITVAKGMGNGFPMVVF